VGLQYLFEDRARQTSTAALGKVRPADGDKAGRNSAKAGVLTTKSTD
jgi:hypothetical protein